MIKINSNIYASFESAIIEDNIMYFSEVHGNDIYTYDIEKEYLKKLCSIDEENIYAQRLFSKMLKYEDNLYLIPWAPQCIYVVNVCSGLYKAVPIPNDLMYSENAYDESAKWTDAVLVNDTIFFAPASFPGILKYNITKDNFGIIDEWMLDIKRYPHNSDVSLSKHIRYINERVWLPLCAYNLLVSIEPNSEEYDLYYIGEEFKGFSDIAYDGKNYWLSPRYGNKLVSFNNSSAPDKCYVCNNLELLSSGVTNGIEFYGGKILVFPQINNRILCVDITTSKCEYMEKKERSVVFKCANEDGVFCFDINSAQLIKITKGRIVGRNIIHDYDDSFLNQRRISDTYNSLVLKKMDPEENKIYSEDYSGALEDFINSFSL